MNATIQNEFLTLTVADKGAEVISVKNAAGQEMIWQADPSVWGRHAPILFPWTGKLVGGSYTHAGKEYKGGQHGFARDMVHRVLKAEGDTIVLELSANEETFAKFPFDFTLTSTLRLEGKTLHHTLTVRNNGAEPMPFGIGYHPAFLIPFDDAHTTEDYEFRFEKLESPMVLDTHPEGLTNGKCSYAWKNTDSIPLTDALFENDSFCMAGLKSATLGIYEKDTGKNVTCNIADYPYTLIWSAPAKPVRFVCIEPWQALPGNVNDGKEWGNRAATTILQQGECYSTTLSTTFDR